MVDHITANSFDTKVIIAIAFSSNWACKRVKINGLSLSLCCFSLIFAVNLKITKATTIFKVIFRNLKVKNLWCLNKRDNRLIVAIQET